MGQITNLQLLSLYVGGADGNKRQDAAAVGAGQEVHLIKSQADGATFSVITAVDQNGDAANMLTANNLTAKVFDKGDLLFAPFGGYISAYTCDTETEYFKMAATERERQTP